MDVKQQAAEELVELLNNELSTYKYDVAGELNSTENGDAIIFTVTCSQNEADMWPTLELAFDEFEDEDNDVAWGVRCTLSFPTLTYDPQKDYPDNMEYYLGKWADLGKAITRLNKIELKLNHVQDRMDDVVSATDVVSDKTVQVTPGDEEILYKDDQCMLGDVEVVSLADIKNIWNNLYDSDECMAEFDSFDDWWAATKLYMHEVDEVDSCSSVDIEAASKVDQSDKLAIDRYLHSMIGAVDEALSRKGIKNKVINIPDEENTGMMLSIQIEDIELFVEPQDMTWDWDNIESDADDIADMTLEHISSQGGIEGSQVVGAFDLFLTEDDEESEDTGWKEIATKMVPDNDGFMTDYTLYESTSPENSCQYICMFGDRDIYTPDEGYADMSFDDLSEAEDWFYSYEGLLDDEEILSDTQVNLDDEPQSEDIVSSEDVINSSSFCYALKHGFGPGTIPKDVDVLNFKEEGHLTIVELDRELTPEELDYYDIRIVE